MDEPRTETLEFLNSQLIDEEALTASFYLLVMAGPDKGAVFDLAPGVTTLGRSERCDIPVTGRGVSRVHAAIQLTADGTATVEDRGSTNGVFVDRVRVEQSAVKVGETIALGPEVQLRFESSAGGIQNLLQEMYQSATLDPLTGLYNRRSFEDRLDEEFSVLTRHKMESCLAVVDVDHFKSVNDTEGHDAGDQVLRILADLLKAGVRAGDIVGRWGGEEFVMYIRQAGLEGAVILLDRLRERVSQTDIPLKDGRSLRVTFSSGVVPLGQFQDWRQAFTQADECLYASKDAGRNKVTAYRGGQDAH